MDEADELLNQFAATSDAAQQKSIAEQLQKTFATKITFRQLMGECASLERLASTMDAQLPQEAAPAPQVAVASMQAPVVVAPVASAPYFAAASAAPATAFIDRLPIELVFMKAPCLILVSPSLVIVTESWSQNHWATVAEGTTGIRVNW